MIFDGMTGDELRRVARRLIAAERESVSIAEPKLRRVALPWTESPE